jgi:hypothetical protein
LRALSTWPFSPPGVRPAFERFALEDRLPPDDLRVPPDDARLDGARLLLEAVRERALPPFALEPPREDAERVPERPPLDEPRLLDEPLLWPDFEVPWAILASLWSYLRLRSRVVVRVYESALPTRSTSSPSW